MTTLKDFAKNVKGDVAELRGPAPTFEDNKAYLIELTGFTHKLSSGGFNQAEITISKVMSDDSLKKAGKRWLTLPVYSDDISEKYDAEKLAQMRSISANNFAQLLRAAMPTVFGVGGSAKEISAGVQGAAEQLVEGEFPVDLVGTRLYYVSIRGTKNPEKTYDGWFAEAPTKYELAEV